MRRAVQGDFQDDLIFIILDNFFLDNDLDISIAAEMSHHFTTYFYIIAITFIIFIENLSSKNWTSHLKKDIFYILITSISIFTYWGLIAKPVYKSFMNSGFKIGN